MTAVAGTKQGADVILGGGKDGGGVVGAGVQLDVTCAELAQDVHGAPQILLGATPGDGGTVAADAGGFDPGVALEGVRNASPASPCQERSFREVPGGDQAGEVFGNGVAAAAKRLHERLHEGLKSKKDLAETG